MTVEVLGVQDRRTECATAATPAPERLILSGEFVAVLVTVTLPVTLPVAAGVNVTFKVAVCPGVKMIPVDTPPALKPAPRMLTFEMETLEFPALVSVTFWLAVLDRFTLPKLNAVELEFRRRVAALTVKVAAALGAVPTPLVTVAVN